ncbi:unnamed protein product [Trifolium pratense]|uniref:Uncharacterized protein n=1 Tax=Trifolium pratense TaxID=57577 RepID=A0ACB0KLE1_TRIPR|nr:unnamed protein product [Trifolium pratense]
MMRTGFKSNYYTKIVLDKKWFCDFLSTRWLCVTCSPLYLVETVFGSCFMFLFFLEFLVSNYYTPLYKTLAKWVLWSINMVLIKLEHHYFLFVL